jgi:DNA-binding response OmpR family regulator
LTSFKKQLEDKYDIYTAQNFEDFNLLLKRIEPDLIILDIEMPGFNGFDVFRMVRDSHYYDYIPIMYLSQLDDEETVKRAMSLGADDFMHKSITKENLIMRIEKQLDYKNKKQDEPIILAVNKDTYILYTICNILKGKCKVYALSNPEDVQVFLSKISPDLVLLDYKLFETPDSNIFSTLLNHVADAESSFIFITNDETTENISSEYATVAKPIDAFILEKTVLKCLKGYKARRAIRSITSNQG